MAQQTSQVQQIPDEAYRLGETYQLGVPTAVYRVIYTRADMFFFWSQIAIFLLMFVVAVALIVALTVFHAHLKSILLPVILALSALNIANYSRAAQRRNKPFVDPFSRNLRVYVYPNGFIRLRNSVPDVVRWDQIKRVRYIHPGSVYGGSIQHSVTVVRNDGKRMGFGTVLPKIDELGTIIEHEYYLRRHEN